MITLAFLLFGFNPAAPLDAEQVHVIERVEIGSVRIFDNTWSEQHRPPTDIELGA